MTTKKQFSHSVAMLDIETLSTEINAVITSIGCIHLNIFTGEVIDTFYESIDHDQPNRHICDDTVAFWESVKAEGNIQAYDEIFNETLSRISLVDGLNKLNHFIQQIGERTSTFGNGNDFDNAIIKHAMFDISITPSWDHGCDQNLRTAVFLGRTLLGIDPKYDLTFDGIKHHALDDAIHEGKYLHRIISEFKGAISC